MPRSILNICLKLSVALFCLGCSQGGPTLPLESIDDSMPEPLKTALIELYGRDTDDVIASIRTIGDMKAEAKAAVPYLVSMLTDTRLGVRWTGGYGKTVPVSKIAAGALGQIGEPGITAMVTALSGTEQRSGMEDDLLRESVAVGLKTAMDTWGEPAFTCLQGTNHVPILVHTAQVCMALEDLPGRFDDMDPRRSLKFYKHFDDTKTREGLQMYIRALGFSGDREALDFLESVYALSAYKPHGVGQMPDEPFETEAVIAQYRIRPLNPKDMDQACLGILMTEFTARGDLNRINILLDQGITPDITTRTGQPLIELAWKQQHPDMFETLINHGANVDVRISGQDTLLIKAARDGDHEFVKALLDHGADTVLINTAKETALEAAISELFSFWDKTSYDTDAKPYFTTIEHLQAAGSPPINKKMLKDMEKKSREFLKLNSI